MTVKLIGWAIQRYWVSVSFPTFVAWAIWADWSHTQEWKKQKEVKKDGAH